MGIAEKIANAKKTNWVTEGISDAEVTSIIQSVKKGICCTTCDRANVNKMLYEMSDEQQTIKAQTGYWIIDGHHIQCSKCRETMCNTDREGDPIPRNFCPNCGTRMVNK